MLILLNHNDSCITNIVHIYIYTLHPNPSIFLSGLHPNTFVFPLDYPRQCAGNSPSLICFELVRLRANAIKFTTGCAESGKHENLLA
jgi:hypothetical protein